MKNHTIHIRDGGTKTLNITRDLAIKLFCTECLGYETHPKDCTSKFCPLYPYRGKTQCGFSKNSRKRDIKDK